MMFQPYNCSEVTDISPTITANCGSTTSSAAVLITNLGDEEMNKIRNYSFGNYSPSGHDASRIVDENGVAPTVKENHGTVTAVAREVSEIELIDDTNLGFNPTPKIYTDYAPTLRAGRYGLKVKECDEMNNLKIRKLTPKECYRLMGFDDEDFYKAEAVNSNSQLYKQAGNSIVVDVIEKIYEKLFERYGDVIK